MKRLLLACLLIAAPAAADFKIASARFTASTSVTTVDYEITGFGTPVAAMVFLSLATTDDTDQNSNELVVSFMDGTEQWSNSALDITGQGTTVTCHLMSNSLTIMADCGGSTGGIAAWDSWATNGVTLDWTEAASSAWDMTIVLIGGSSPQVDVGDVDLGNSDPTTRDVTEPGFTPDIVIIASSFGIIGGGSAAHAPLSFGACTSSAQMSRLFWSTDSVGSAAVIGYIDTDAAMNVNTGGITTTGTCSDFDANGFTLTITGTAASNADAMFLALDTGIAGAEATIKEIASPTSATSQDYTGFGLQVDWAMFVGSFIESTDSVITTDDASSMSFGFGDSSAGSTNGGWSDDGAGTSSTSSFTDGQIINVRGINTPSDQLLATMTSSGSDGFTLNWTAVSNAGKYFLVLAFQLEEPAAGGQPMWIRWHSVPFGPGGSP